MRIWLSEHFVLLTVISITTFLAGIAGAVVVAIRLPENYFPRPPTHVHGTSLTRKIIKNIVGALILLIGFAMSLPLVPGPGVIVMLVGLSMMDFPGKKKLEIKLLRFPGLLSQLNRIRLACGRPPLNLPAGKDDQALNARPS